MRLSRLVIEGNGARLMEMWRKVMGYRKERRALQALDTAKASGLGRKYWMCSHISWGRLRTCSESGNSSRIVEARDSRERKIFARGYWSLVDVSKVPWLG
jgi:hypothetical protein